MPSVEAREMGTRIAEARGRAAMTQLDLAAATSLDRSAVAKIETGTRRVSALELARIADAVGVRIEWFLFDAPPAIVSHRNRQEPGAASPRIDQLIERVVRNVEFLVELDGRFTVPELPQLERPNSAQAAEDESLRARRHLEMNATDPFTEAAETAEAAGILTFSFDLGTDAADAASVLLPRGAVVLVNGSMEVGRRRMAFAHELGHCFFADEYTVDWTVAGHNGTDAWEPRLDRFGRALLLPRAGLDRAWTEVREGGDDTRTAAVKLASRYRVDMSTLARRLAELGLIDSATGESVRQVRTRRADFLEFGLVSADELAAPSLPRSYERAVLRLFRNEVVSGARAIDLLFDTWHEDDLPPLPDLPESAIWGLIS